MKTYITFILTILCTGIFAQSPSIENTQIVNGFATKISGSDFSYHSSVPTVKKCLLIRATNGKSSMEWQTEPIPEKIKTDYVTFI